jgi:uncharacterized membrane protein (DUF2068 family)
MENFSEYLEELADFKRSCTIKFRAENGAVSIIQATIQMVEIEGGRGYIKVTGGQKINISQLIEVNGRQVQNIC